MDFFDAVTQRTSVRSFNSRPIEQKEWDALLGAAMAAPSAVNCQPWDFVVVEDRDILKALAGELPYAKMTADAGGAVVVCTTPARANRGEVNYAVIDASAACENLLLAATALGLGAVWTAVFPNEDRASVVRSLLGIPDSVIPLALVPIGEPKGSVKAKNKFRKELIHRGAW